MKIFRPNRYVNASYKCPILEQTENICPIVTSLDIPSKLKHFFKQQNTKPTKTLMQTNWFQAYFCGLRMVCPALTCKTPNKGGPMNWKGEVHCHNNRVDRPAKPHSFISEWESSNFLLKNQASDSELERLGKYSPNIHQLYITILLHIYMDICNMLSSCLNKQIQNHYPITPSFSTTTMKFVVLKSHSVAPSEVGRSEGE